MIPTPYHHIYLVATLFITAIGLAIHINPKRLLDDNTSKCSCNTPADNNNPTLSTETNIRIAKRIDNWVNEGGYTNKGITLEEVASIAASNRTYVSKYINATYGCSFRVWVNRLRIERAKNMLLEGDYPLEYIAKEVGYASYNSFIHTFKRYEGVSTTQWLRSVNRTTIPKESKYA